MRCHMRRERARRSRSWHRARYRRAVTAAAALLACGVSACSSPPPASRPAEGSGRAAAPAAAGPDAGITFPLHTRGALIADARGKPGKLAMVSCDGAGSPGFGVGGLAEQPVGTI